MFFRGTVILFLAVLAAGTISAQEMTFNTKDAWTGVSERNISLKNGVLTIRGRVTLVSRESFDIDPGKTYTLTGSFKAAGSESAKLYFGFSQYDKNGTDIQTINTDTIPWTDTVLLKPVKAADKVLVVNFDLYAGRKSDWFKSYS